mmetsp:Transcript_17362/g.42472  ORF Transcript_17362/g.42472 Transcript_17362/m.42472 type:complete len:195 (-) Transcript_17362:69-653(-)
MSRLVTPEKTTRPQSVLRDPNAGFMKIPFSTKDKLRRCCCGNPECHFISKDWKDLGDIRGAMIQLPNISNPHTRKQKQRELKIGRLDRINWHLKINCAGSSDTRNRSKEDPRLTRTEKARPKRQNKFLAAHHIDPIILSKYQREDCVPLDFLKEHGLCLDNEQRFTRTHIALEVVGNGKCLYIKAAGLKMHQTS